jgi:uncharacterized protein (DUF433 family)
MDSSRCLVAFVQSIRWKNCGRQVIRTQAFPYVGLWVRIRIMVREYVRNIEGVYLVGSTRVPLDSLVYLFREGVSAESMVESYPALTLEQVHGALAFYLANQDEVDTYLTAAQRAAAELHEQSRRTNAEMIAKIRRARHENQIPSLRGS